PAKLPNIFLSKLTFALCWVSTLATMGTTIMARSRSYDLMYSQVTWRTCKFTISILGSRQVDCSGRSRFPQTQSRYTSHHAELRSMSSRCWHTSVTESSSHRRKKSEASRNAWVLGSLLFLG